MEGVDAARRWEELDGRPVFRPVEMLGGGVSLGAGEEPIGFGDVFAFGEDLAELGRYGGRERIDGAEAHVTGVLCRDSRRACR